MSPGIAAEVDVRFARAGRAAFALARRICGDEAVAADIVEQAFASVGPKPEGAVSDGLLLRRVRSLACGARRPRRLAAITPAAPPPALAGMDPALWRVLDLVALRGTGVRDAAAMLQLPEVTVLARLREAMRRSGRLLSGPIDGRGGQSDGQPEPPRLTLLG